MQLVMFDIDGTLTQSNELDEQAFLQRIGIDNWSLINNVFVVLITLSISAILLAVNSWLSLLCFLGCSIASTALSIGCLVKQVKATT